MPPARAWGGTRGPAASSGAAWRALAALVALALPACRGADSTISVVELPTSTVLPDGSTTGVQQQGAKRVRLRIESGRNELRPDGVEVSWRLPGGPERSGIARPEGAAGDVFAFDLPGSESLRLCEPMLYRWVVNYDAPGGTVGVYMGEERTVMVSARLRPDGSVEKVPCG